jgi:signal transduction histidine kinase
MSLPAEPGPRESAYAAEDAMQALAGALPIGVVLLDGDRLRWGNARALDLWATDAAQLRDRAPASLFEDADVLAACLASPGSERSAVIRRPDGAALQVRVGTHALAAGASPLVVLHVFDLTEKERIRAEVAAQREELQTLARRLLTVQEDERRTLSRELHDDIGQQLTAIKLGAMALQDESEPALRAELLAEILATTDQTLAKLRDLSTLLRPPQLDALGLEAALRWQAERMFRSGRPRLSLALTPLPRRPDPAAELACFRIAQEAMTNIQRHAQAAHVAVNLGAENGGLELSVRDDGRGFDPSHSGRLGLVTMRERAEQVGGRLEIDTAPGRGSCVRAYIPLR